MTMQRHKRKRLVCIVSPGEGSAELLRVRWDRGQMPGCSVQSIGAKSDVGQVILGCTAQGDCELAVESMLRTYDVEFWVLRHVGFQDDRKTWRFEWQSATPGDLYDCCKCIGYDMTDYRLWALSCDDTTSLAKRVVWDACHRFRDELRERERER